MKTSAHLSPFTKKSFFKKRKLSNRLVKRQLNCFKQDKIVFRALQSRIMYGVYTVRNISGISS